MKNTISIKEIEMLFEYSEKVYSNSISKKDAIIKLSNEGINKVSADYYIQAYTQMRKGKSFSYSINANAADFFLKSILRNNGIDSLETALNSLKYHIDYYAEIKNGNVIKLSTVYDKYKSMINIKTPHYFNDEFDEKDALKEGALIQIHINSYERNRKARANCIKHYGAICQVCNFNFEKKYGKLGEGFIHVHHVVDISTIKTEYEVDPIKDLVPVCPNCHAMLHKNKPAYDIEKLKSIITNEIII